MEETTTFDETNSDTTDSDITDSDITDFDKALEYVFDKTKELAPVVSNGLADEVLVVFDPRSTRVMARCFYRINAILYSKLAIDLNKNNQAGLDHLIIHELSHFVDHTHGKKFKENMLKHGVDGDDNSKLILPSKTKFLRCKNCGHITKPALKSPQNFSKIKCNKCGEKAYVPYRIDSESGGRIEMRAIKTDYNWISFVDKVYPESDEDGCDRNED